MLNETDEEGQVAKNQKDVLFAVEDNNMLQARVRRGQTIITERSSTQFILPPKKTGNS